MSRTAISSPLIRYLPANKVGRDFVVGDLHGCRMMLDRLLAEVRFDPAVDRLFSVGDLVDRGPDSMGCLALLNEPWFHAVRGNHEDMMLEFVWETLQYAAPIKVQSSHAFLKNGGEWILGQLERGEGVLSDALTNALAAVQRLPLLIVVGKGRRRFHVVHTDLYHAGKPDEVSMDEDIDTLAKEWGHVDVGALHPEDLPYFAKRWLWSRLIMGRLDQQPMPERVPGLSATYCGHTIGPTIRRALSHVCIDTGAFVALRPEEEPNIYGLTMIDIGTQQVHRASST